MTPRFRPETESSATQVSAFVVVPRAPEKEPELWGSEATCVHVVVSAPGGGIRCTKCPGWFCY